MPFGVNLPGVTWNSWYNPLDNAASGLKNLASGAGQLSNQANNVTSVTNTTTSPGMQAGSYPGSLYYNPNTGGVEQSNGSTWSPVANVNEAANLYSQPDPYAAWGGKSNYDALKTGFNTQKENLFNSANQAVDAFGQKYGRSILDFLDQAKLGQQNLDTQAAKNELAKQQGTKGILEMVGQGIKSGGVQLANRNAGDSSAAGAIANAYGTLGRQQLSNVGNQYALGQNDLQQAQGAFDIQQQSGLRNLQGSKQDAINSIVNDARSQLASLDAQIAQANLPDRIALDQAKQDIQNRAIAALQQYDQQLTSGVGNIKPISQDQARANAAQLAAKGTDLGANAFNYSTEAPVQFQNTGPSPSTLPIYTYKSKQFA